MIVGCWLARHGLKGRKALERLRELWQACPKSSHRDSPETREQIEYILDWSVHCSALRTSGTQDQSAQAGQDICLCPDGGAQRARGVPVPCTGLRGAAQDPHRADGGVSPHLAPGVGKSRAPSSDPLGNGPVPGRPRSGRRDPLR